MEHIPQAQRDEQYPLLKVESGAGDNVMKAQLPPKSIESSGWHVTCTPKQSWCSRLPEFISACWMTTTLLAISFLIFYSLGMNAYRRQQAIVIHNGSKPASDVFYHHVVPRDAYLPFSVFSEYISHMAKQYPQLHFNVYFLIDDSWPNSIQGSRHLRFLNKLMPPTTYPFNTIFGKNYKKEIKEFQRRYQNVKINVMHLSKYMAMTPLRHKWRIIPANYLSFYARVYAIWQNGGIGFDLVTFNNQYNQNQVIDHRIQAILQQHNDGIESEKYADTFNSFDNQEQSEIFSMFSNMINNLFTYSFFDTDSQDVEVINAPSIIRTHRSKREVTGNETDSSLKIEVENQTANVNFNENNNTSEVTQNLPKVNVSKETNNTNNILREIKPPFDFLNKSNTSSFNAEMPPVLTYYFYDISRFEWMDPFSLNKNLASPNLDSSKYATKGRGQPKYLALTPEGYFLAASSRHHPLLSHLFSSGCQRVSPQFAIKDALLNQCSGFLRDDVYCENIRVLYNVV